MVLVLVLVATLSFNPPREIRGVETNNLEALLEQSQGVLIPLEK